MKKKGKFVLFALFTFLGVFIAKKVMKGMFGHKEECCEDLNPEPEVAPEESAEETA